MQFLLRSCHCSARNLVGKAAPLCAAVGAAFQSIYRCKWGAGEGNGKCKNPLGTLRALRALKSELLSESWCLWQWISGSKKASTRMFLMNFKSLTLLQISHTNTPHARLCHLVDTLQISQFFLENHRNILIFQPSTPMLDLDLEICHLPSHLLRGRAWSNLSHVSICVCWGWR